METTGYYVTLRRETGGGVRVAWLAGPYATHEEALAHTRAAWAIAEDIDPRCFWDACGTASITRPGAGLADFPRGRINDRLPPEARPYA